MARTMSYMGAKSHSFALHLAERSGLVPWTFAIDGGRPVHSFVRDPSTGRSYDARGGATLQGLAVRRFGQSGASGLAARPLSVEDIRSLREAGEIDPYAFSAESADLEIGSDPDLADIVAVARETEKRLTSRLPFAATPDAVALARAFVFERWRERQAILGHPDPADLSGSCKFTSLFAARIFGGLRKGNDMHEHVRLPDGSVLDLNAGAADVAALADPYRHDPAFWNNPDHRESVRSCGPRVDAWARIFLCRHGQALLDETLRITGDLKPEDWARRLPRGRFRVGLGGAVDIATAERLASEGVIGLRMLERAADGSLVAATASVERGLRAAVSRPDRAATRTMPPPGTRGGIVRTRHGWFDGSLAGTIVSTDGRSALVRDDDGTEHEIRHPRDFRPFRP
jgi:hypothetical protein